MVIFTHYKLQTRFMALQKKVKDFLEKHGIGHELLEHKTVYTAFDAAQTLGVKVSEIAKTLALKVDKKYILVVVPASRKINLDKLKKTLGAKKIEIVKEVDIQKIFKIKAGRLLPFGTFHKVPIYVDKLLLKSKVVIVSAGSFTESLKIKANDLLAEGAEALTSFSKEHKFKIPKKPLPKKKTAKKKSAPKKNPAKKKPVVKKKSPKKNKKA